MSIAKNIQSTTLELTPKQAREMALLCFADHRNALWSLADQVEALTKERDSLAVCYEAREEEAHQLSERIIKLTKERDALMSAADSHKVVRDTLTARLNVLEAAAKLALDALHTASYYTSPLPEYHLSDFEVNEAISALYQVGVQ